MNPLAGTLAGLMVAVLAVAPSMAETSGAKQEVLIATAPGGITFTVTADGLSSIKVGDVEVARGGWHAVNADGRFKAGSDKVRIGKIIEKSIEVTVPGRARVRHVHEDAVAVYDYEIAGEDVTIHARVENNHPDEPLAVAGFEGLAFTFAAPPQGQMPSWHVSYLQHVGIKICHPSYWVRVGGSWAADGRFGAGLTPLATGPARTMFHWDRNWAVKQPEDDKGPRRLAYYVPAPVPPGGARAFAMRLRVSANTDWRHLLEPYKEHFLATWGPLRYKPDHRPVVQFASADKTHVTPDNPFGFNGPNRRFDLPEGAKAFCDWVIPGMKEAGAGGIVFWALQGHDPREAMYRPDFDVFPPPIEANLPTLNRRFTEADLRWGVCARPGEIAYRANWTSDTTVRINPDDPEHIGMMLARFKKMADAGCTVFYLDTFGSSLEDVRAMIRYRERLGADVQTYVEHQCDAVMPYSGAYTEVNYSAEKKQYGVLIGTRNWEVFRWLLGDPSAIVVSRCDFKPAGAEESVFRFLMRNRMSPMVGDWQVGKVAPELKALGAEFLEAPYKWR